MRSLTALLLLLMGACGSRTSEWHLPNGYLVFAAGSTELYVANPQRDLLLGPSLKSIGVSGDLVVAFCGWEPIVTNGFKNTIGYSLLDTKTGQIVRGLDEQQVKAEVTRLGHHMPEMASPQRILLPSP